MSLNSWKLSRSDFTKIFGTEGSDESVVMSMYVRCLIEDDSNYGPKTTGYRIFLYPKISVSENFVSYNAFLYSLIFSTSNGLQRKYTILIMLLLSSRHRNCCCLLSQITMLLIQLFKN